MIGLCVRVLLCLTMLFKATRSDQTVFRQCLAAKPSPGVMGCAGRQALHSLNAVQESDNFTIDNGFTLVRVDSMVSRELPSFLEQDPMDFRGMLENAGAIVGQRSLQWDLGAVQPGLCLRIGPTPESSSMLEFIMDPNQDRGDRYVNEDPSTARILAHRFLVPFLLGVKFNLLTILPLFFGAIILLCKKAAFLGKIALFVSGLVGFGSAFSLGGLATAGGGGYGGYGGYGGFGGNGFGGNGFGGVGIRPHINDLELQSDLGQPGGYYKRRHEKQLSGLDTAAASLPMTQAPLIQDELFHDRFYEYEKKVLLQDRHRGSSETEQPESSNGYRTFVWKSN